MQDAHRAEPPAGPAAVRTILIADDEPSVRRLLIQTLSRGQFITLSAADGEETLRLAREHHPTVILLDAEMPRVHGYEVCRQIKSDPQLRDITVIMVTAKAQETDRQRALEAGADDFVSKPFSPRDLLDRLERTLAS
jgi:two-component system, OmpR family, phosphate regulon response regulator PhoB